MGIPVARHGVEWVGEWVSGQETGSAPYLVGKDVVAVSAKAFASYSNIGAALMVEEGRKVVTLR